MPRELHLSLSLSQLLIPHQKRSQEKGCSQEAILKKGKG